MSETHATFCRICEASCGLLAEVEGDRVIALRPDRDHVVSRGFACVKGTQYQQIHHSPDRVTRPQKRVGDTFVEISWPQAMQEIGDRVRALRREHGPECMGVYAGNPTPFSPLNLILSKAFATGLKTPHVYTPASLDCNNKFVASREMFGSPMIQPIPDLDASMGLLFMGTNPVVSNMTFVHAPRIRERLAAVIERGGFVAYLNPRRTESAELLGDHHFIRPSTDVFFLLSFARELLARRGGSAHLDETCVGADALRRIVEPWSPERSEQATRVPADELRALAERFGAAQGAAIYLSTGVNQGAHGSLCAWLAHCINLVTDNVDRAGGLLVTRQMSRTARMTYPRGSGIQSHTSRVGGFRNVFECEPVGLIPEEVAREGPGQLRALIVSAGNLMLAAPNTRSMERSLRALDLLVTIDLFRNETGELADYVLPATSFLERDDMPLGMTGYQPIPYLQYAPPVVDPVGEARDEAWIFTQLARACRAPLLGSWAVQSLASFSIGGSGNASTRRHRFWTRMGHRVMTWFYGRSFARLRRKPHGMLMGAPTPGRFLPGGVLTDSGKVALAPKLFVDEAGTLDAEFERELDAADELRLVSRREKASHNSWMHNVERFVRSSGGESRLLIHPDDAGQRGLGNGDMCRLATRVGEIVVPVRVTDEMMPGTVSLPHGWGHQKAAGLRVARETSGQNFNVLTADGPESLERLSGMARLTGIAVTCSRVEASPTATPSEVD